MEPSKSIDFNLNNVNQKNCNFLLYNTISDDKDFMRSRLYYLINSKFHDDEVGKYRENSNKEYLNSIVNYTSKNSDVSTPLTILQRNKNKTELCRNPTGDYESILNSRDENRDLNLPYSKNYNVLKNNKGNLNENYNNMITLNNEEFLYKGNPEGIYRNNIAKSIKFSENKLPTLTEINDTCEYRSPSEVIENNLYENSKNKKSQILNDLQKLQKEINNKFENSYLKKIDQNISNLYINPKEIDLTERNIQEKISQISKNNGKGNVNYKKETFEKEKEINANYFNKIELKSSKEILLDKINESTYRRMSEKSKQLFGKIKNQKGCSNASRLSSEKLGDNEIWREKQAEILDKNKGATYNPNVILFR